MAVAVNEGDSVNFLFEKVSRLMDTGDESFDFKLVHGSEILDGADTVDKVIGQELVAITLSPKFYVVRRLVSTVRRGEGGCKEEKIYRLIELVMSQVECSCSEARAALKECNHDVVEAIMQLSA